MNAWPKLVSEEMVPSAIAKPESSTRTEESGAAHTYLGLSLEPLLQETWLNAAQDYRVEILRSASRLQAALQDLFAALEMGTAVHPKMLAETHRELGSDTHTSKSCSNLPWNLSKRETLVLHLMRLGLSNKGIAREMRIAPETVKSHIKRIFIKLASKNRAEAVSRAAELGLL